MAADAGEPPELFTIAFGPARLHFALGITPSYVMLNGFRLEMWGLAAAVVTVGSTAPQLSSVPKAVKWVHWALLGIYYPVGLGSVRFLVRFCLNHARFVKDFGQANVLEVAPSIMQGLAVGLGLAGTVLLLASVPLARFRRSSRLIFSVLAIPVGVLYPIVVATASGAVGVGSLPLLVSMARGAALILLCIGCFAVLFYQSKFVAARVRWT